MRILIAEDQPELRRMLVKNLTAVRNFSFGRSSL